MYTCSRCGSSFVTIPLQCPGCGFHLHHNPNAPPQPPPHHPNFFGGEKPFWQQFREASIPVKILALIGLFMVCGIPLFGGLVLLIGGLLGKFAK